MTKYLYLKMNYTTYSKLCDAIKKATNHTVSFYEIQ